jgi:hypothetical protein
MVLAMRQSIFIIQLSVAAGLMVACVTDQQTQPQQPPAQPPLHPDVTGMGPGELQDYFLAYEGTPQHAEMDAWLRQHRMEIYRDSEGSIVTSYGIRDDAYDDVASFRSIAQWDTNVAREISRALHTQEDLESYSMCVAQWRERGGSVPTTTKWSGVMHIEAKDGIGRLISTEARYWPDEVDEELRRCTLAYRAGRTWSASRDYSFRIQTGGYLPGEDGAPCGQ